MRNPTLTGKKSLEMFLCKETSKEMMIMGKRFDFRACEVLVTSLLLFQSSRCCTSNISTVFKYEKKQIIGSFHLSTNICLLDANINLVRLYILNGSIVTCFEKMPFTGEIDALNLEIKGCKNCNPEKNTFQSHQKRRKQHLFSNISHIKREKVELFYQNQSPYHSYLLPKEFKYSETTLENIINPKTYCKICHKEYDVSLDNIFLCFNCKSYYHQSCHDDLTLSISEKKDVQWNCFECRVKESIKKDKDAQFVLEKQTVHDFSDHSDQFDTIELISITEPIKDTPQFTKNGLNIEEIEKIEFDSKTNKSFDNISKLVINNSIKNTSDFDCHLKNISSNIDLIKTVTENTFNNDHVESTLHYNILAINENDAIEYDTGSVSEAQSNVELLHELSPDNTCNNSVDMQNDNSDCIEVEDVTYELQLATQKKIPSTFRKRGRPRKTNVNKKPVEKKIPRLKKKISNTTKIHHVLKPLRKKKRFSKKQSYTHSFKSFKENINYCSNILQEKQVNVIKEIEVLEPCDKYKGSSRKKTYRQDANNCCLNNLAQEQKFSHLFKPAPKLPVETRDGQRLSRKYRKKYNICDLRYVHVHRQSTKITLPLYNINENQNKNDIPFDILSLVPREVIPVITSNSQLGFREAIIDKRLMRYKRGVPIFRVGRKIPGELS
ncbi:hypothetical protein PMAC_001096 [Pneumocystis sp. 'macacae']|nr:hypothetical protein PMAC_001096 [Pneumocystis sp. 'macacae']